MVIGKCGFFKKLLKSFDQGGLNKKEIQLNLCNKFSILIFNEFHLFTFDSSSRKTRAPSYF